MNRGFVRTHFRGMLVLLLAMVLLGMGLTAQETKARPSSATRQDAPARSRAFDPTRPWINEFGLDVLRLSPRAAVVYGGPWDSAIVALATQKGMVVVDAPFSKRMAQGFREAIQAEFKRDDFAYLINTHEHLCHVDGNAAYADVPIVGHDSLRQEMDRAARDPKRVSEAIEMSERQLTRVRTHLLDKDPKQLEGPAFAAYEKGWRTIQEDWRNNPVPLRPDITFDKEMTLHLGDLEVRLIYYGHSHGIADTLVSIPKENLILTAGICYPSHVPQLFKGTEEATPASIENWFSVMRGLLSAANEDTRFLASHGRAILKKGQYQNFVSYLEGMWKAVRRAKTSGKTLDQAKVDIPLKDFPEAAKLPNVNLRGTEWENLDIHGHNIEHLWKVLDRTTP